VLAQGATPWNPRWLKSPFLRHGDLALLACLYSAHCDEYKPYERREGATMADAATAELTEETAVTGPADDHASDLADDVLVEEVSIDGMCGVY